MSALPGPAFFYHIGRKVQYPLILRPPVRLLFAFQPGAINHALDPGQWVPA